MLKHLISLEKYSYNLCGKIAVDRKIISYSQLLEALDLQCQFPQKKLGEILQELQYTDEDVWNEVLMYQSIFQQRSPVNWAHIPNTVIKGTVALKGKLGRVDWQQLQKIDISGGQKLQDVLMRLQLITNNDIKKFLQKLESKHFVCDRCKRDYDLFEYCSQELVLCPVCRDNNLQALELPPTIVVERHNVAERSIVQESEDEIVQEGNHEQQNHKAEDCNQDDREQKVVSISVVNLEDMHEETQENAKIVQPQTIAEVEDKILRVKATPVVTLPPQKRKHRVAMAAIVFVAIALTMYLSISKSSVRNTKSMVIDLYLDKEEPKLQQPPVVIQKKTTHTQKEKRIFQQINSKVFVRNVLKANLEKYTQQLEYLQKQNPHTKYVADYKNFRGRLLFYQLWLNVSVEKNNRADLNLLHSVLTDLEEARQLYVGSDSIFQLRVMPWMPEAKRYRVNPWDREFPIIDFNSLTDAQQDIENLLKEIRFFKDKYYAEK